ncbi:MAG: TIGR03790 family protein [Gammaproteobacteria bacterium]|nr:TIGR03790 family protein [Gammaproteobacteria bacterium]
MPQLLLLLILTTLLNTQPVAGSSITPAIGVNELAVIINDADPISVQTGLYYATRRGIPSENVIHISIATRGKQITPPAFEKLKHQVDQLTPEHVQAYALTWTTPYRVGCMSITTAFAAGFDPRFCAKGCKPTRRSRYFNSNSHRPYDDTGWRPTMMIAGKNLQETKALIDRGIASDESFPWSKGYLVSTSDQARNVRAAHYPATLNLLKWRLDIEMIKADHIQDRDDILFYFTGLAKVPHLKSNRFRPGAIADHLTSAGGKLTDSGQMSSLEWLSAGATGSYGAVTEPCNFIQKFPIPAIVMHRYLLGEPLIEAYWKSVAWPGQGVFIGEPLARPFAAKKQ